MLHLFYSSCIDSPTHTHATTTSTIIVKEKTEVLFVSFLPIFLLRGGVAVVAVAAASSSIHFSCLLLVSLEGSLDY